LKNLNKTFSDYIKDKKEKIGGKWVTTGDYLKIELGAQGLRLYKAIIDVTGHYRKENVGGKKQRFLYLQDYDDVADTKQRIKRQVPFSQYWGET